MAVGKWIAIAIIVAIIVYFALTLLEPNYVTSFVAFVEKLFTTVFSSNRSSG